MDPKLLPMTTNLNQEWLSWIAIHFTSIGIEDWNTSYFCRFERTWPDRLTWYVKCARSIARTKYDISNTSTNIIRIFGAFSPAVDRCLTTLRTKADRIRSNIDATSVRKAAAAKRATGNICHRTLGRQQIPEPCTKESWIAWAGMWGAQRRINCRYTPAKSVKNFSQKRLISCVTWRWDWTSIITPDFWNLRKVGRLSVIPKMVPLERRTHRSRTWSRRRNTKKSHLTCRLQSIRLHRFTISHIGRCHSTPKCITTMISSQTELPYQRQVSMERDTVERFNLWYLPDRDRQAPHPHFRLSHIAMSRLTQTDFWRLPCIHLLHN